MSSAAGVAIVLASTSRYRRELLERLVDDFRCVAPGVDETPAPGEAPAALAARLASAKAASVARDNPGALVIGSDQVADLDGSIIGKPGSEAAAVAQLAAASGRALVFHTALCVLDNRAGGASASVWSDTTRVRFRVLDPATIERYVRTERPLDCAGSFKAEGRGIALFERIESEDPTALIGLPLIALARLLREAGIAMP
jgi:7-methyl-GTP pyrophosphatase